MTEDEMVGWSSSKESACDTGGKGSIPGLGSSSGEGNGNPLQYSCPRNSMDIGAWLATVHEGHKEPDTTEPLTLSLSPLLAVEITNRKDGIEFALDTLFTQEKIMPMLLRIAIFSSTPLPSHLRSESSLSLLSKADLLPPCCCHCHRLCYFLPG